MKANKTRAQRRAELRRRGRFVVMVAVMSAVMVAVLAEFVACAEPQQQSADAYLQSIGAENDQRAHLEEVWSGWDD